MVEYAQVITENNVAETDRTYTYKIPEEFIDNLKIGMRVIIPFGYRKLIGIVVDIDNKYEGKYKLKSIIDIIDKIPLVDENLLKLSKWVSEYYLSSYIDSIKLCLPPGDFKKISTIISSKNNFNYKGLDINEKKILQYINLKKIVDLKVLSSKKEFTNLNKSLEILEKHDKISINLSVDSRVNKKLEKWVKLNSNLSYDMAVSLIGNRAKKQMDIYLYMNEKKESSISKLMYKLNVSNFPINELIRKNILLPYNKEVIRNPIKKEISYYEKISLNDEQKKIYERVTASLKYSKSNKNFLIHGITGSGKTEVYLQIVEKVLEKGKDAIILVPEISLTPQTIDRFVGRFGDDVAVLHSKLSLGERFDQWRNIKQGKARIVVGARSAVFAPVKNLGIIIIDEEHENSYKSSQNPKYNTIEVAEKRSLIENSILLLGSATPSIDSYYKANTGKFKLLTLKKRANKKKLPKIDVVDMRMELEGGNRTILSRKLYKSIQESLSKKEQIILFLNRRGFSNFISCRSCGYVAKCKKCEISLTYHNSIKRLKCHYCGETQNAPIICPNCSSKYIKYFGIGTEQVESFINSVFPHAITSRLDADTTNKKNIYEDILGDMKAKKIDILIGTQMVAKGLDFEGVTTVGIIAADTTINLPDYKSAETSFQLITQVAGRAGRGKSEGRVILQTYNPSHYSILLSKDYNYLDFYETEISLRKAFLYPPFTNLIVLLLSGSNMDRVKSSLEKLTNLLKDNIDCSIKDIDKRVVGPYPSPISKINNNYRFQTIFKIDNQNLFKFKKRLLKVCYLNEYKIEFKDIKVSIDINPSSIL